MRPFHRIEDSKHRNRFIRGRLVPPDNQPKLIADSSRYQTPEVQADRQYWMRIVSALLAMSTIAVLLVVILRVMRHRKHLEKRFEEMDEEDDLLENGGELKTSLRDGIILLIFVGVLIAGVGWLFSRLGGKKIDKGRFRPLIESFSTVPIQSTTSASITSSSAPASVGGAPSGAPAGAPQVRSDRASLQENDSSASKPQSPLRWHQHLRFQGQP